MKLYTLVPGQASAQVDELPDGSSLEEVNAFIEGKYGKGAWTYDSSGTPQGYVPDERAAALNEKFDILSRK